MNSNPPVQIAVVTLSWNCAEWIERSLRSIQNQDYPHFRCVVIDDVSTDGTYERAQRLLAGDPRFTLIRNTERRFQMANALAATRLAARDPDDVIVVVDGDDWLKHERVFSRVAEVYADPGVWLTYGNSELYRRPWRARLRGRPVRGTQRYPAAVEETGLYRYHQFLARHLRTYRKFLFDAVRDEDLRDEDGSYYWAAGDAAIGFPMLEMATARHIRYLDDILYVYNNNHALSDNRPEMRDSKLRIKLHIAARPRYAPLVRP